MYRVMTWSTVVAGVLVALLFGLSAFLSLRPFIALSTWLEPVALIAYHAPTVPIQYQPDCARYDARVTYLLRPGRCRYTRLEFDTVVEANSFGLRDDEESLVRPEVIVLGDSFAMGEGVENQEAFPQVLERALGRKVLNAGVSSFGTARELILLRLLDTSAARVIVIQHHPNDLRENLSLLQHGTLPILPEQEYQALVRQTQSRFSTWFSPGVAVLQQLGVSAARFAGLGRGGDQVVAEVQAFSHAVAGAADLLRGRQVVVLELSNPRGTNDKFINEARSRLADLGLDLTFVDVSPALAPGDYFALDGHLRPSGHEKVAEILAQAIGGRPEPGGDAAEIETDESAIAPRASGS